MPPFFKSFSAKKAAAAAGILLFFILIIPYLVDINDYKGYIEEKIGDSIGHRVSIKNLKLYIGFGVGVQGVDFTVYSRDSSQKMFFSPKVVLYLSLKELLLGRVEVKNFALVRPEMTIIKSPKGAYNVDPKEPKKPPEKPLEKKKPSLEKQWEFLNTFTLDKLKIGEGRLDFIDRTDPGKSFSLRRILITLSRLKKKKGFFLYTHLLVTHPVKGKIANIESEMEISGLSPEIQEIEKIVLNGDFRLKNLDFSLIKPHWIRWFPWIWLEKAKINLEGSFKGQPLGDFELKAELKGKEVEFAYPEIFSDYLPGDRVSVKVGLRRKGEVMDVLLKEIGLKAQKVKVEGSIDITDVLRDNIAMDLDLKLSPFNANFARKYISYPVIPEYVNRFIRDSIPHGIFLQAKVKLKGTIDEIADITVPGNQGVLAVSALVMAGVVNLPGGSGEITDIDGKVRLEDGKITFENVSGLIGASPLKIPYFQIDKLYQTPVYDLKADLEIPLEHRFVKKYLLPAGLADSSPQGSGTLSLGVKGTWNDLTASGLLNLNQCAYSYSPWFKKPEGQPNEIRFDLTRQGDWLTFPTLWVRLGMDSRLVLDNSSIDFNQKQQVILVNPSQIAGADLLQNSGLSILKTLDPGGKFSLKGRMILQKERWELSGDLDLTKLEYHYPSWLEKPAGAPNQCRFTLNIIPEKRVDLSRLEFKLEKSKLDLSGSSFLLAQDRFRIKIGGRLSGDTYRKYLTLPVDFLNDLNPNGWAGINLKISKETETLNLTGDLDLKELEYKYKDVFIKKKGAFNTCRLELRFPQTGKSELTRLELLMDHGSLEISEGEFSTKSEGSGSLPIKIRLDHQLLQTNLEFPWLKEMDPDGPVTGELTVAWTKEGSSVIGALDLSGLDYHYENYLKKPAGLANRIEYEIGFGKSETRLKKIVYRLNGNKMKVQIIDSRLDLSNRDSGSLRFKAELRKSVEKTLLIPIFESLNLKGVLRGEARLDWSPSAYRLAGMLDLTPSDYRYDSYLVKPSGVFNRLNIDLLFPKDREKIELAGLQYRLAGSKVEIVNNHLDLKDLQKGSLLLKIVLGEEAANKYFKFPFLNELNLKGKAKGKVNIDWNLSGYRLSGALDLTGAGYRYRSYLAKPLKLSNKIEFAVSVPEKNRYKINQLGYYINQSLLGVSGSVDQVSGLEYDLAAGAVAVELRDVYPVLPPEYAEKIISMEGIAHMQGAFKKFPTKIVNTFNLKLQQGKISLKNTPVNLYRFDLTGEGSDENGYRLETASGSGDYKELFLENISASAFYNPSRISIDNFTAKVCDGLFSGNASIQYDYQADHLSASDKYQIEVSLTEADASEFLRGLRMGSYKKISGLLSFSGHLSNAVDGSRFPSKAFASRELYEQLKRDGIVIEDDHDSRYAKFSDELLTRKVLAERLDSARYNIRKPIFEVWRDSFKEWLTPHANGDFNISLKKGRIKGYAALNRVLYFVNPDGLVKSKQEDFGRDSYPYKSIKGNFKLKNGIFHTENLLLDSNSWKILVLGDIDYPEEKLDLRLFVQPLRMVDSMIDSIPLIGRVVKGKNRGFIEACFKVKGPYQDPDVSSIQMKNLLDKTFGILGRFFTLPMNLPE